MAVRAAPNDLIASELLALLACPDTGLPLHVEGQELVSKGGERRYPVVDGVPCLIPAGLPPSHAGWDILARENRAWASGERALTDEHVAGFMAGMIVPTCGNLFRGADLSRGYPIPDFPVGLAAPVLELGCNWGRWSIAGAQAGQRMIGVDIHLESLLVAKRLAAALAPDHPPHFVLADGRRLPFKGAAIGGVVSYSVLQHFSKANAELILNELARVLRPGGRSIVQMPNAWGLKSLLGQAARGFGPGREFDVRYYTTAELLRVFDRAIGHSEWSVDCFFGLNVHAKDRPLVRPWLRPVISAAELAARAADALPVLARLADSVWVCSQKGVVTA